MYRRTINLSPRRAFVRASGVTATVAAALFLGASPGVAAERAGPVAELIDAVRTQQPADRAQMQGSEPHRHASSERPAPPNDGAGRPRSGGDPSAIEEPNPASQPDPPPQCQPLTFAEPVALSSYIRTISRTAPT